VLIYRAPSIQKFELTVKFRTRFSALIKKKSQSRELLQVIRGFEAFTPVERDMREFSPKSLSSIE
jgi:hypothetical protein